MKPISTAILAGGKSSRMGMEKGLINWKGKSMIEYAIDASAGSSADLFIITENQEYKKFGYTLYPDLKKELGPIGGLHTALEKCNTEWLLMLACDIPNINSETIAYLIDKTNSKYNCIVPTTASGLQPLCALYNTNCKSLVQKAIDNNNNSLRDNMKNWKVLEVPIDESVSFYSERLFNNINSPHDLAIGNES